MSYRSNVYHCCRLSTLPHSNSLQNPLITTRSNSLIPKGSDFGHPWIVPACPTDDLRSEESHQESDGVLRSFFSCFPSHSWAIFVCVAGRAVLLEKATVVRERHYHWCLSGFCKSSGNHVNARTEGLNCNKLINVITYLFEMLRLWLISSTANHTQIVRNCRTGNVFSSHISPK